ncbi:Wzz/FepE/Etk N-terminal domain-containing protein [Flavobacterium sp. UW10123]|uniref:Wzz/FepE/Etk N-terminal domain-containing protein n=1 Tax=Flavobacterium sp. UW10123 TaxID=3230800 RepID=UPI003399F91C
MNNTESNEMSLKELIDNIKVWYFYLLKKWKSILIAGLFGSVLGLTYSFIKKPIYTATLSFALEDDKTAGNGLGNALGLASSLGLDLGAGGGSIFSGGNLTELFKSRSMVEKTLLTPVSINGKTISLAEMYIEDNKLRENWKKISDIKFLPNEDRKKFSRAQDSILGKIYDNLSNGSLKVAQKDKKVSIVTIDMSSDDELFAKYFVEALVKEVSNFYIETKSKKARINMSILEKQTDSIRKELNSAITGVAIANDNTFNLNPALNVQRAPSSRRQVDVQANGAILTELIKQSELAKVTLRKETPLIQVIDRPILPLKKDYLGKFKGLVLGSILGGILMVAFLIMKKIIKTI